MPCPGRNLYAKIPFPGTDAVRFSYIFVVVMISHSEVATQDNVHFVNLMMVDGHYCPGLHCVQEPLALVVKRLMEIVVNAQTVRCLGFLGQPVQKLTVDDVHVADMR